MKSRIAGAGAVAFALAVWELAVQAAWVDQRFLSPPSKIFPAIYSLIMDGTLVHHTQTTLERIVVGFGLSVAVGVSTGILCALWAPASWTFGTVVETIRAIPALAMLPAFMLFFGIGFKFPVAVVFWVAWIPIFLNTIHGIRNVDRYVVEAAKMDGAHFTQMTRHILIPLAFPSMMVGMRLAVGNSFVVIVVAEMIGSTSGLGFYIFDSMQRFQITNMYATIVFLGTLAWGCNWLLTRIPEPITSV